MQPEVNFFVYKSPSLVPVLTHISQVHALPSYIFKIHFNIILPSTFRSSKWSVSFRLPNQNPVSRISPHSTCVPHAPTLSSLIFSPYQQHVTLCTVSIITMNGIWLQHAVNIIFLFPLSLYWFVTRTSEHRNNPWKASTRIVPECMAAWYPGFHP